MTAKDLDDEGYKLTAGSINKNLPNGVKMVMKLYKRKHAYITWSFDKKHFVIPVRIS